MLDEALQKLYPGAKAQILDEHISDLARRCKEVMNRLGKSQSTELQRRMSIVLGEEDEQEEIET
jgi:hypothetical protein